MRAVATSLEHLTVHRVPNSDKGLEQGPLASAGLLLQQHNLQNSFLEGCPQGKKIMISDFLDGRGEEADLLLGLDLRVLHQAAQLGDTDPFLVLSLASVSSMVSKTGS